MSSWVASMNERQTTCSSALSHRGGASEARWYGTAGAEDFDFAGMRRIVTTNWEDS
jgi:hypothetical protein